MKCPKERLAIHNRIMAVGRQHDTFNIITCIDKHKAAHYGSDWQEVLNSMVKRGKVKCIRPAVWDDATYAEDYGSYELANAIP